MQKSFEIDAKIEPRLSEINFTDNNKTNVFCIQIFCMNSKESESLQRKLLGFSRIYKMDTGEQDFTINHDKNKYLVEITGNINNAFHIIQERELIKKNALEEIIKDDEVKAFLEKSKQSTLPDLSESDESESSEIDEKISEKTSSLGLFNKTSSKKEIKPTIEPTLTFDKNINAYILVIPVEKDIKINDKENIIQANDLAKKLAVDCIKQINTHTFSKKV